jgi:hypothetical protein
MERRRRRSSSREGEDPEEEGFGKSWCPVYPFD